MIPIPEDAESYSEESTETSYSDIQEALDQPGPLTGSGGAKTTGLCELGGLGFKLEGKLHDNL